MLNIRCDPDQVAGAHLSAIHQTASDVYGMIDQIAANYAQNNERVAHASPEYWNQFINIWRTVFLHEPERKHIQVIAIVAKIR